MNNDIVIADASVSRLHAYVRREGSSWVVADAGSKNGSWLRGDVLEARREKPLGSGAVIKIGEVELTFFMAGVLYAALGGR
jgi:pSer/pThr/pTyr-binding forkhead associated (FHA) protein